MVAHRLSAVHCCVQNPPQAKTSGLHQVSNHVHVDIFMLTLNHQGDLTGDKCFSKSPKPLDHPTQSVAYGMAFLFKSHFTLGLDNLQLPLFSMRNRTRKETGSSCQKPFTGMSAKSNMWRYRECGGYHPRASQGDSELVMKRPESVQSLMRL